MITFVTGNENKFKEIQAVLSDIEMAAIDLPEIQELDSKKVILAKLEEAKKVIEGEVIVEDTSLVFDSMNGLPGPLIKWFIQALEPKGLAKLAERSDSQLAEAVVTIGYSDEKDNVLFFEGKIAGRIVSPRGEAGFSWDTIFEPEGYDLTFAQMTATKKNKISMRGQAARKLKAHLERIKN